MKKLLSIAALALALTMLLSVSAFAAETDDALAALGQKTFYTGETFTATDVMAIDGKISADEGWVCATPDGLDKTIVDQEYRFNAWKENAATAAKTDELELDYVSDMKLYVAQDDSYFYIAIEDHAPYFELDGATGFTAAYESIVRNFYNIRISFDPNNHDRAIHIREANAIDQLSVIWADSYKSYTTNTAFADLVTYKLTRYAADGETVIADSNTNKINQHYWVKDKHQWIAHVEFKFSKDLVKAAYVDAFGEGADADISFEKVLVGLSAAAYRPHESESNNGYWTYVNYGTFLSKEDATANGFMERALPNVISFTADPTIPETEAPETEGGLIEGSDTLANTAETPVSDGETEPATACGGTVSLAGIALVAALGTCTVFVAKKKED